MAFVFLLFLICGADGGKEGFRGGAKSYEIHVEASTVGTNLHYQLPEAKVKAAGKAKQGWLVDNDNAEMTAINSPVLALVSVKHPKFSAKGEWPEYKTNFKVPKDASAKKKNSVGAEEPAGDGRTESFVESSGTGQSVSGSGFEPGSAQGVDFADSTIEDDEVKQDKSITEDTRQSKIRNPRRSEPEPAHKSGLSLFSGLLLPLKKLKNLRLKDPFVRAKMDKVVAHAKKVVSEAKTVLRDASSFVKNVKTLVDSGKVDVGGIAKNVKKTVEDVGSGELGLLEAGVSVGKELADLPGSETNTKAGQAASGNPHAERPSADAGSANYQNEDSREAAGNKGNRRVSRSVGGSRDFEGLESLISSINDLRELLGLPRK